MSGSTFIARRSHIITHISPAHSNEISETEDAMYCGSRGGYLGSCKANLHRVSEKKCDHVFDDKLN